MEWDEFINQCKIDGECTYDGWDYFYDEEIGYFNYKRFYENYHMLIYGDFSHMNRSHNIFEEDEKFNIELKCSFPNIVLVDDYIKRSEEMKFYCEECGHSFIKIGNLVLESGCPYCRNIKSKGEELLAEILDRKKIYYYRQDSYGCINPKTGCELRYDFIIENNSDLIFIEIQGSQHYRPIDYFGGEEKYEQIVYRDEVKRRYAEENGVFVELNYSEHNLKILEERIEEQLLPLLE